MVDSKIKISTSQEPASSFEHKYEPPREIAVERERKMALKMIKTIENMQASDALQTKIKALYI